MLREISSPTGPSLSFLIGLLLTTCSMPSSPHQDDVEIIAPNGGEFLEANTLTEIRWSTSDRVSAIVSLFYSPDSGTTWKYIALDENDGSFSWYVPDDPSSSAFIKVSDYADSTRMDVNDEPFTIVGESDSRSLQITFPNGGEVLTADTVETIRWFTAEPDSGIVSLSFSGDGGISWTAIGLDENDGSFPWVVPNFNSTSCLVGIEYHGEPETRDTSDSTFAITGGAIRGQIEVISPNGGEVLTAGTTQAITWTSDGQVSSLVSLSFSADSGMTWSTTGVAENDGNFPWYVPSVSSTKCLIRVSDYADPLILDTSDEPFTIVYQSSSPVIHISYPDGGEVFAPGTLETITWTSAGDVSDIVSLFVSTDSGSTWIAIGLDHNDGSFPWYVPELESSSCLLKIEDYSDSTIFDTSDDFFTIASGGMGKSLEVLYPNGGEMLAPGTSENILWASTGDVSTVVTIDLSTDNGTTWLDMGLSENGGVYPWTVPDVSSTACLIRISDYSDLSVSDVSDEPFSISSENITAIDSLVYDALEDETVDASFVGFGMTLPMYARMRFTPTDNFVLTHVKAFYRTEGSSRPVALIIMSVTTGNILQTASFAESKYRSVEGDFFLLPLSSPLTFLTGEEFYVVLAFEDVPYPMLATGSGVNGHSGRSHYSDDGTDWITLGDALEDGMEDAWVIRALSISEGVAMTQLPGKRNVTSMESRTDLPLDATESKTGEE